MKPIFGCEVYFTPDESLRKDVKPKLYHLLLLAKNNEGYHNLLKLVSESHVDNFYYKPRTTFSMLQKYGRGIIGSSACIAGVIPKLLDERRFDDAVEWALSLIHIYQIRHLDEADHAHHGNGRGCQDSPCFRARGERAPLGGRHLRHAHQHGKVRSLG